MKVRLPSILLALIVLLGTFYSSALATSEGYTDISASWYTDAAHKYGYAEIFDNGDHKFNPSQPVKRIEFVRQLHKALGITINYFVEPNIHDSFNDMTNTDVGSPALLDLVTAGIIEKGDSFRPEQQLDRESMIHWIKKALDYKTGGEYAVVMMMPAPFADDSSINPLYANDIITARLLNLVNGYSDNTLRPKNSATRAEATVVTSRLMTLLQSLTESVTVTSSAKIANSKLGMTLTLTNNLPSSITINHSSGQKYDFKLFDANGANVYTWSADKMFMGMVGSYTLKPGESVTYTDTVDMIAQPQIKSALTMTAYIIGTSNDFTIEKNGYPVSIMN